MLTNARKATTQQVLTGLETKRQETRSLAVPGNKLIVMLKPSLEIATRQQEATAAHCALYPDPCRPYPARLQHVSVVCLGVFDDRPPSWLVEKAIGALRRIVARPIAFKWVRTDFFGGKRHLVLLEGEQNNAFHQFARLVQRTLRAANSPCIEERHPVPHVTLIYDRRQLPQMEIAEPIWWVAEEFLLILSIYGKGEHKEYGRWHLDRSAPPYPTPSRQLQMDLAA